jgi:hypothetical protein
VFEWHLEPVLAFLVMEPLQMGGCLMAMLLTFSTGGQLISLIIPGSPTAPFFSLMTVALCMVSRKKLWQYWGDFRLVEGTFYWKNMAVDVRESHKQAKGD